MPRLSSTKDAKIYHRKAYEFDSLVAQSKQKYARIVDPMRRIFVTNDEKSTADSSDVEFLEVAYCLAVC